MSTLGLMPDRHPGRYRPGMGRSVQPRDALVPLGLLALSLVELVSLGLADTAGPAIAVVSTALLVLRYRWPWASGTAVLAAVATAPYFDVKLDQPATPLLVIGVATYTMGRRLADHRGFLSVLGFGAALVSSFRETGDPFDLSNVVFISAVITPPYLAGRAARAFSTRNERLREQAEELLRLQDEVRREAAAAERGRIARELHDVIAHSVSAMVVQAAAAEEVIRSDPDRAARAVREVAVTGRRALAETGRLLHLLRDDDDELGLAPDIGLERLDELADSLRRSGFDVDLDVDGPIADLPPGLDVSAYRVVQEAVTNAFKHGVGAARVRVRRDATALRLEVSNALPAAPRAATGSGLGLVGMAERVSVFGGTLWHGADGDRWVLRAELPLEAGA